MEGFLTKKQKKELLSELCLEKDRKYADRIREIISASFTDNSFKDNEVFKEMLEGMQSKVSKVSGDGAYDAQECWDFCHSRGIKGFSLQGKGQR